MWYLLLEVLVFAVLNICRFAKFKNTSDNLFILDCLFVSKFLNLKKKKPQTAMKPANLKFLKKNEIEKKQLRA